jgi:membrane-associated protein
MDGLQLLYAIFHIDHYVAALVAQYGLAFYLLLFVIVFCETGLLPLFFLPGNPLLFICGAFSATGAMNIWLLLATLISATFLGRSVNYVIGRAVGNKAYTHDYSWLNRAALNRTHAFCEKYGGVTLIISPFIAVVRTFAPFVTGVSAMNLAKFQIFNLLGACAWAVVLVVGGNLFGDLPFIRDHMNIIVLIGVGTGLTALLVAGAWKLMRARAAK